MMMEAMVLMMIKNVVAVVCCFSWWKSVRVDLGEKGLGFDDVNKLERSLQQRRCCDVTQRECIAVWLCVVFGSKKQMTK